MIELTIYYSRSYSLTPRSSRQPVSIASNMADSDIDEIGGDSDDCSVEIPAEFLPADMYASDTSDSDDEISDDEGIDQTDIYNGPKDKLWRFEKKFDCKAAVDEFLSKESWWSYRSENSCTDGIKFVYRCNRVKRSSKHQCEAKIHIIESTQFIEGSGPDGISTSYSLFRRNALHTHRKSPEYKEKVSDRVINMIIEHYKNGRKPKTISYLLLNDDSMPLKEKPSYVQIRKIIRNFKNNGSGAKPLTMRKLTEFVKQHMQRPVKFERSHKKQQDEKFFRLFLSTNRLLRNASKSKILHADATHKVTTEKVPIIVAGVTDNNSKFHFAGLTIANHETAKDYQVTFEGLKRGVEVVAKERFEPNVLVCDGDTAIHNAFTAAFGYNGNGR